MAKRNLSIFCNTAKNQKGFTLVELMLGLLIIGAGLIGIVGLYNVNSSKSATQEEIRNLDAIRGGVKELYGSAAAYTGVSNTILTNAGVFPDKMKKGASVKNVWGGDVTVAVDGGDSTKFTITYALVPKENCLKLGAANPSAWVSAKVGATSITDVATANTACAAATNTLVFTSN